MPNPISRLLCALPLLLPWPPAPSSTNTLYDRCLTEAGAVNNTSVLSCSESVSAQVKREINTLYARLHAKLAQEAPEDADKLEQTQKAWLQYRNGHCALATSMWARRCTGTAPCC